MGETGPSARSSARGTFTISNLGSLGVEMFTPVINPRRRHPRRCGLMTRVRETDGVIALPGNGALLTYDHRAVDGAPAARFMAELTKNLENFAALLAL